MSKVSYKNIDFISSIQKDIVRCEDKRVLVNGCAGSRKTDTLVKRGFRLIDKHNHSLLFLTLVSSVSDEIKQRMETLLNIHIDRKGTSNHYLGRFKNKWVEIANFDAWIHKQLAYDNAEILSDNADCHSLKTQDLLKRAKEGRVDNFVLKNDEIATAILVDEFQDLSNVKVQILMEICKKNPNINITCVGDYLQTIFQQAITGENNDSESVFCHPMDLFKTLKPQYFQMDICYRCPSAHLRLVNHMMMPYQIANDLKPIKAHFKDDINKPFLFPHGNLSKNHDGQILARQVKAMLEQVMEQDSTIKPSDVAIIMRKSNNQPIFEQMKKVIGDFFYLHGYDNSLCHFETRHDGYHNTIDWSLAEGKAVMLSIHGDKGKGHKIVFFLGLTQKSIPDETSMFKKEELIYQSLTNVALTRSTKYLFVGFTYHYPSFYLTQIKDELPNLCFCSWMIDDIENEFYKNIAEANNKIWSYEKNNSKPDFNSDYRTLPLSIPSKSLLSVSNDISKDIERPSDIMSEFDWKKNVEKIVFGKHIKFETKLHQEGRIMIGVMSELIFLRKKEKRQFIKLVRRVLYESVFHFTEDERILNLCYDFELNQYVNDTLGWNDTMERLILQHSLYLAKNKDMFIELKSIEQPKYILHVNWSKQELFEQFKVLINDDTENEDIPPYIFWNFSLLWNDINQKIRKPLSYRLIHKFQESLDSLHDNLNRLMTVINGDKLIYQTKHSLCSVITNEKILRGLGFQKDKEIDKFIFEKGYTFGINGISDFIWKERGMIIEIKASSRVELSNEWIIQALMYGIMGFYGNGSIPINIMVVNVLEGKAWVFELGSISLKMRKRVLKRIMNFYQFHPILKDTLYLQFKKMNNDLRDDEIIYHRDKIMDWLRIVEEERAFFKTKNANNEKTSETSGVVVEF